MSAVVDKTYEVMVRKRTMHLVIWKAGWESMDSLKTWDKKLYNKAKQMVNDELAKGNTAKGKRAAKARPAKKAKQ